MTTSMRKALATALAAAAAGLLLTSCALVEGGGAYTGYDLSNAYAASCTGFEGASLEACRRQGTPMGGSGD